MNALDRLAATLAELLRADARRVLVGEDILDGTMLGVSKIAAADPELRPRLVETPLTPTTALAYAGGLALGGLRPIVVLGTGQALLDGLAGLREVALLPWRSDGERSAPILYIAPTGPGFGLGGDAGEGIEAVLTRIPGLRVVIASHAHEIGAVTRAAAEFWAGDEPTLLLVPRGVLLADADETGPESLDRPFCSAFARREGSAATVFAWGEAVGLALQAVDASGVDAMVVELESLSPLPRDALVQAAKHTGKIVIVHAGPRDHGIGAELAAMFADEAILTLDAPVTRVCGPAAPIRPTAEAEAVPSVDAIVDAIVHVANY